MLSHSVLLEYIKSTQGHMLRSIPAVHSGNLGTTKIRNGHFLAKWGEMGMFLAKWEQNGHVPHSYSLQPHANTSLTVSGSVFRINRIKINLKKSKIKNRI